MLEQMIKSGWWPQRVTHGDGCANAISFSVLNITSIDVLNASQSVTVKVLDEDVTSIL